MDRTRGELYARSSMAASARPCDLRAAHRELETVKMGSNEYPDEFI